MRLLITLGILVVVQMIADTAKFKELLLYTGEMQAQGYLAILMSPTGQILIIAIDIDQVRLPKGHIATPEMSYLTAISLCEPMAQEWQSQRIEEISRNKEFNLCIRRIAAEQLLCLILNQPHATSADKMPGFAHHQVVMNEVTRQENVTIYLNDIVAR